jgi:hypothetical protein
LARNKFRSIAARTQPDGSQHPFGSLATDVNDEFPNDE